MASYTQISDSKAKEILALYGLENIKKTTPISSGISNTNYAIELADGNQIVLKISNSKPTHSIKDEQAILFHLNLHGFDKCLVPLKTLEGSDVYEYEGLSGVIYPFIQGNIPEINIQNIHKIGVAIAELHLVKVDEHSKLRHFSELGCDFEHILEYINGPDCPPPFKNYFIDLIDADWVNRYLASEFKQSIIHGDLYYDNCLFSSSGDLLTVLDFEQSGIGYPLFDIGISISGCCLKDGKIDKNLLKAFLNGYQSIKKLNKVEVELIDFAIMMGLFSIALWRIERFNKNIIDSSKTDNYLELLQRAADYAK
jgi:homoserine kinase type II